MMYVKRAQLFNMVSTNTMGIITKKRVNGKLIYTSEIQGITKADALKTYGIEKNVVGQVFSSTFNSEDLMNLSYIEIDDISYYITQVYNYNPSHSILLLEAHYD